MFTLENIKLNRTFVGFIATATILTSAIATERAVDGGIKYETKDGKYTSYYVNTQKVKKFNFGRKPTKTEVAAWDTDIMPDGTGLPKYDIKNGKVV